MSPIVPTLYRQSMSKNKSNTKKKPMLRVRVQKDFEREIDHYIEQVNASKRTNFMDRSSLVREAVSDFMTRYRNGLPA